MRAVPSKGRLFLLVPVSPPVRFEGGENCVFFWTGDFRPVLVVYRSSPYTIILSVEVLYGYFSRKFPFGNMTKCSVHRRQGLTTPKILTKNCKFAGMLSHATNVKIH